MSKTNAMRILDKKSVAYNIITYENKDGKIDGVSVANKIGRDPETVFKTLVGHGKDNIYVFIIPVQDEVDYKKAASATEEKKIELINVKDIIKYTGYIRGGCSPIGMKKAYPTFIHESSLNLEKIIVSGGKIGMQIELNVEDLKVVTEAAFKDLIK